MDIGNTCGRTAAQHGLNLGDTCFGVPAKGKCTRAEVSTGAWLANVNSAAGRHDVLDVGIFYAIGNHPSPTSQMSDGCLDCVFVSIVNNMGGFEVTHEYFRSDSRIDVVNKQLAALNYCAPPGPPLPMADVSGGVPTNGDSFHVLDFALGSLSAALLLVVAVVVARQVRRSRQPHAPTPISEADDSGKDDEKAALTEAV
jgi:hypothetical protein